ncbi:MAG: type III secretion system export apparatus subunit SctV [Planctomycetaceae bacterium]|nr:type III secretion system export apparatus subunit SctV [Planctomycetaceae bacterium]
MGRFERAISAITRYNDITLVVLIISIIALMILPMPTYLVDMLLAVNLGISVIMLLMAMYIRTPLEFAVFPTLLLFTTLFRLALNITTTRLILLKADAGYIIETFGRFVVAGDFVVGAVVFLILTIMQFLVIAKGSERVAEVAARFTLDAMPGKQMSIDADMRAGVIDMNQARERRETVSRESQLYGALDGAMKFVKGDAIAGLIVTAVNISGGLVIGVLRRGMSLEDALARYGILTIGDGLISQIPALFISITAGIIVTRVSSSDSEHLGGDIGKQVFRQPKAIMVGGCVIILMGFIPGFPKPQFFLLGTAVIGLGYGLWRYTGNGRGATDEDRLAASMAPAGRSGEAERPQSRDSKIEEFSITVPLLVDVAENARELMTAGLLNDEIIRVRRALYYDLGVPFPGIRIRYRDGMEPSTYQLLLQEVPVAVGWLEAGKMLSREPEKSLQMMGFTYEEGKNFLPGLKSLWLNEKDKPRVDKAKLAYLTNPQVLSFHLSIVLKRNAHTFVGIQETRFLLGQMEQTYGELVKEVQRVMSLQKIAEILQRLVQEQVSIRNLRAVLEALLEWAQKEKDAILLTEYVRAALRRHISYQHAGAAKILPVYMIDLSTEEVIRKAIRQTASGSYLALEPAVAQRFVETVKHEIGNFDDATLKPVLLTNMDIRRYVRKLVETDFEDLAVLSYQELSSDLTTQPLGRINVR